jgi:hypothetical protein
MAFESRADHVSSDEDELYLPDSDGEDHARNRFKSFREPYMENPVFKVGMIFDSVEMLRKAITEYNLSIGCKSAYQGMRRRGLELNV